MTDIKNLRALLAAATPGPWDVETQTENLSMLWGGAIRYDEHVCSELSEQDASLIAAAVNALPALLDEVEALWRVADAARAWREVQTMKTREDLDAALAALKEAR